MKLNKSLYGIFQAPKYWNEHLTESLGGLVYKPSENDPYMFFGNSVVLLYYVDDILVFGPGNEKYEAILEKFREENMGFIEEEYMYAFLGVVVQRYDDSHDIKFLQDGLIEIVIKAIGLEDENPKKNPATTGLLVTYEYGENIMEDCNYASVIGMLVYIESNSHPDIHFEVHQCERFTHSPK